MLSAILNLTRLNKPVGIYLLWFPCAWALCLGYPKIPPIHIVLYFSLGTIIMRSAGCVLNDIADRNFDAYVARTRQRPLANHSLSLPCAWLILILLFFLALIILSRLPKNCFYPAIPAALLCLIYPFCKRYLVAPQFILGLAFSASIPMVYIASHQPWSSSWSLLILITLLWVLAYDTQYALADIDDDKKIGVLSTAVFFKQHVKTAIICLQILTHSLWLIYAYINQLSTLFYLAWLLAWWFWIQQYQYLHSDPLQAFKNNTWYGLWMWIALILEKL